MASKSSRLYTGLAGLPSIKEPHRELFKHYGRLLRALGRLPQDCKYRTATEQIINERKSIVESTPNYEEVEKKIGAGLCEELIEQAKHELHLVETMSKYKPWEPLEEKPPKDQWRWPL